MTRDKLKSTEYWEKYLVNQDSEIKLFFEVSVQREKDEQVLSSSEYMLRQRKHIAAKKSWIHLLHLLEDNVFALYSSGAGIIAIKDAFQTWLDVLGKKESYTYLNILLLFSWTVLFDNDKDTLVKALSLWEGLVFNSEDYLYCKSDTKHDKTNCSDRLLSFLLNYIYQKANGCSDFFDYSMKPVLFEEAYGDLCRLILLKDKEEQVRLFTEFMNCRWYNLRIDEGWHDSHKSKYDIYVGYWAFECAAVAKVLQFSEDDVRNLAFFPVDLFNYFS